MKPEEMLKKTTKYRENLEKAKRLVLAVGLPKGQASNAIYGDGMTVVEIGAIHEYGAGNNPVRSFLRVPFKIKKDQIQKNMTTLFRAIAEQGADGVAQMEKAGVMLQNISKEAFETKGFGTWKDIKASTKRKKGSSATLIDTGILRGAITYEVRNAS